VSKKYIGKQCVYCVEAVATTADHVISREFFLKHRRANAPKVAACARCNNEKSELEHYLTVVLALGGRHPDAKINLDTMVLKRLQKNAALHRELLAGFEESGGTALPIDHVRVEKLFALIARGLAWYHWNVLLGPGYSAVAALFSDEDAPFFDQMLLSWGTPHRMSIDLGNGTFKYYGAQATDCPQMTIWRFWMLGGVLLGGDPNVPGPSSLAIAITGPDALIQRLASTTLRRDNP
jgi:hypothetical protein